MSASMEPAEIIAAIANGGILVMLDEDAFVCLQKSLHDESVRDRAAVETEHDLLKSLIDGYRVVDFNLSKVEAFLDFVAARSRCERLIDEWKRDDLARTALGHSEPLMRKFLHIMADLHHADALSEHARNETARHERLRKAEAQLRAYQFQVRQEAWDRELVKRDGTALVLEEFGNVIARGGAGIVIASQSGHRLPPLSSEQNAALATTPVEKLLTLPMPQPDQVKDSLHAYQLSKRGNSLRVMAEAVRWGKRGARVNTISPGIIITPLANDELKGPRGSGYRRMIELSAAGRAGTPDEVGNVGALLLGPDGAFISGSDFLMDGGVTAAYWFGELAPK
jgi:NAD(P)-dependent dehydrogenase (short-subunit alcohol dehydrogenase family)